MTILLLLKRLGFAGDSSRLKQIPPGRNSTWLVLVVMADLMIAMTPLALILRPDLALMAAAVTLVGFILLLCCIAWSRRQHRLL